MAGLALFLIGAPGAGKSAVFDALTLTPEGSNWSSKGAHRIGNVKVPDERLARLRDMYNPRKYVPAEIMFIDVAPPMTGKGKFKSLREYLSEADAFVLVVQAFGEFDRDGQALDPAAQLESMLLELIISDLDLAEKRLDRVEKDTKRKLNVTPGELEVLRRCKDQLENEQLLSTMTFREDELKILHNLQLLSRKPILLVANVAEEKLDGSGIEELERLAADKGFALLRFCAPLEAEIAQLSADEQRAFLEDYGIEQPARSSLIRTAYQSMDLLSFFTVGEDEVRAWTIRRGTDAQRAAGKIHSDLERGFIRAEVVEWQQLLDVGSLNACKENATLRLEGKTYVVKDGDVMHIRSGV